MLAISLNSPSFFKRLMVGKAILYASPDVNAKIIIEYKSCFHTNSKLVVKSLNEFVMGKDIEYRVL